MCIPTSTICPKNYRGMEVEGMRFDDPQATEMSMFSLILFILVLHLVQVAYDGVQPVTATLLSLLMIVHVRMLDIFVAPLGAVGLSAGKVWQRGEFSRIFISPLYHVSDWHLLYCMVSFAMKARCIEPYFGKGLFFWLVAAYAVIVNALVIPLAYMAYGIFGDSTFISRHAFGITGIIFALKVLTTQLIIDGNARVFVWAEFIIANMLMPRTTALTNVAGTIVGALSLEMLWDYIQLAKGKMAKNNAAAANQKKKENPLRLARSLKLVHIPKLNLKQNSKPKSKSELQSRVPCSKEIRPEVVESDVLLEEPANRPV